MLRLAGTVREVGSPAPALWKIHAGAVRSERRVGGTCVVEVDGHPVAVDASDVTLAGGTSEERGAFGDLAARAGCFAADLAPSFQAATLSGCALEPGDRVELYGEVTGYAAGDDGSYRDAPTRRIESLRAILMTRGPSADAEMARLLAKLPQAQPAAEPPDPRRSNPDRADFRPGADAWTGSLIALAALLAMSAALAVHLRWVRDLWPAPFGLAAAVLVLRPRRFTTYRVRAGRKTDTDLEVITILACLVYAGTLIAGYSIGDAVVSVILTAVLLAILLARQVVELGSAARHRALAKAPAWTGELGSRVRIEGTVQDATPILIGDVQAALGRETKGYMGNRMSGITDHEFGAKGSFTIETAHGMVEVEPNDVVWTSTVTTTKWRDSRHYTERQVVPVGGQAAAVGWVEAGTGATPFRLRPRGTQPVILFATSAAGQPRGLAARMARGHLVTWLGLIVLAVGLVVAVVSRPGTTVHRPQRSAAAAS